MDAGFNIWWGLVGLIPLLLYIILVLREMDPLPATVICVAAGALINAKSLVAVGTDLSKALGSFLGLVGLIMMLGRGLGEVLLETKVAHTLVYKIIYGIGVNTQKKAMLGIMMATMVIVALLGTMAGGVAIIAPIVNPIAAAVGLTPAAGSGAIPVGRRRSSYTGAFYTSGGDIDRADKTGLWHNADDGRAADRVCHVACHLVHGATDTAQHRGKNA